MIDWTITLVLLAIVVCCLGCGYIIGSEIAKESRDRTYEPTHRAD